MESAKGFADFFFGLTQQDYDKLLATCGVVREWMVEHYGSGINLAGHCIEASELIVKILHLLDFSTVHTVEGWALYDRHDWCEYPYEMHTWVELGDIYLDVTADQFNYGMYSENQFKGIMIHKGLPHGIVYALPRDIDEF